MIVADVDKRTKQLFRNISPVLEVPACSAGYAVTTPVTLSNMVDPQDLSEICVEHSRSRYPGRSNSQKSALQYGSNKEAEAIVNF